MEAEGILCENYKYKQEIFVLEDKIKKLEEKIKQNEKKLWFTCKHVWERDYDVPFDDRVKYKCANCNLWRRASFYL